MLGNNGFNKNLKTDYKNKPQPFERILHGKVIRALGAWNVYVKNNKVSSFRKIWNQRVLRRRLEEWRDAARNSRFANRIRKFLEGSSNSHLDA